MIMAFLTIDQAPCPPYYVDDIYNIFIQTATESGLNTTQIEHIRVRCDIEIPTTTTTAATTTTTTSPTAPTTAEHTSTTEDVTPSTKQTTTQTTISASTGSHGSTFNSTSRTTTNVTGEPISPTDVTTLNSSTVNVTDVTYNVTIATQQSVYRPGCGTMCTVGIATSAGCLAILLLSLIGITMLFKKGRHRQHRSTSRSRTNRFADIPNTDIYDSVDIEDCKRNSGSSFIRRSRDYSKTPLTFDNPAYRRSFELRPHRYNSWYDPEATDYEYSQTNAYLVPSKSRVSQRRSMSASRLNDRPPVERVARGSSHSLHNYVPKVCHTTHHDVDTPYTVYTSNRVECVQSSQRRHLPRTNIEHNDNRPRASFYRSRSFDPSYTSDQPTRKEPNYYTVDNKHTKNRKSKFNLGNQHVSRRDNGRKSHHETNTVTGRDNMYPSCKYSNNVNHGDHTIISSNLHPSVSLIYKGHPPPAYHGGVTSRSYRERDKPNMVNVQPRQQSYKPRNNVHMFQTKL